MMTTRRCYLPGAAALSLLVFTLGCGGPVPYTVSGKVTFNGKPVPAGYITFAPDGSKGNSGPGGGAPIRDGEYRTEPGKGIVGGPYVVRIVGTEGVPATIQGEQVPEGRPLFAPYVTEVDLPHDSTVRDFEVPTSPAK